MFEPIRSRISSAARWRRASAATALIALSVCAGFELPAQAASQEIVATALFADKTVAPGEAIKIQLSRALQASEGRIAIFIGQSDMTSLFTLSDTSVVYNARLPLPAGENIVVLYLASPADEWKEIARFTLRVSTSTAPSQQPVGSQANNGARESSFTPALTIGLKSQPAESHFPDSSRPERQRYTDFTLQGSIRTEAHNHIMGFQSQFDVTGSSYRNEALRFAQEGANAPRIDLSSYLMQFQLGKARVQVGHFAFGTSRHLVNNYSSRGITLTLPITSRFDFSAAAVNGSSIVGWNNFFGLSRRKHQIVTGAFGFEIFPERPGALRVETGALYGSLLPISNFNQGNITDAEQSKGASFRITASDPSQRLRIDAGFARSLFSNPADPLLDQSFNTVSVRDTTRNARYIEASFTPVQNIQITPTKTANLTFNYHHETIDPLFRSIAAYLQADRFQNQFEAVASIADITATLSHLRYNDNLDQIPSILKTLTRQNSLIIGAPLMSLFGDPSKPSVWLPRLSYTFQRTHQFGDGLPANSGFDSLSQVPDQQSDNQGFLSEWQAERVRFGFRFNRSFQDNRQSGRERADLGNLINAFTIGMTATSTIDFNIDLSFESAKNFEQNRTDRTKRLGANLNWRMTRNATLASYVSTIFAGDLAATSRSRNAELDIQWSYRFALERSRYKKIQAQFFVRYANRYAYTLDNLFGFDTRTRLQTFNTGLSFTFW